MKKFYLFLALVLASSQLVAGDLAGILAGDHRADENKTRDSSRHPIETLEFFRIEPGLAVVEIWPGRGWYTEVLAPFLSDKGTLHAAHFSSDGSVPYFANARSAYEELLASNPEHYGSVELGEFDPGKDVLTVADGSVDRVLTFRNVHNWLRNNSEQQAFGLFFKALKPGGMLGVVEHRSTDNADRQWMLENGYMDQDYVVGLANEAGFQLVASSEINANAKDTTNHPMGVWTLPPTLRMGEENKESYLAIGERDRMTLLFIKPE